MKSLTVAEILSLPKRVVKARVLHTENDADARLDVEVRPSQGAIPGKLIVFLRVPVALHERFSIGLRFSPQNAEPTVLVRVNGDHSGHKDPHGGRIDAGPHLHEFKPPLRSSAPVPGARAKWAWPLPPENLAVPTAWRTFCRRANLASTPLVDAKVRSFYLPMGQLRILGL